MYKIQLGNKAIDSKGGISLIGALLRNVKSFMKFDVMTFCNVKKGTSSHSSIVLFSFGRTDFADIKFSRDDKLFRDCLHLSFVPSEEIFRKRLDCIAGDDNSLKLIDVANVKFLSLGTLAYNCLRILEQIAMQMAELRSRTFNVTIRLFGSVMQALMFVGRKIVSHDNINILNFSRHCPYFKVIRELYARC